MINKTSLRLLALIFANSAHPVSSGRSALTEVCGVQHSGSQRTLLVSTNGFEKLSFDVFLEYDNLDSLGSENIFIREQIKLSKNV